VVEKLNLDLKGHLV